MYSHQTQLIHAAQRQQEEQRVRDEQRRRQQRRVEESYIPGTSAYRQRTCIDSASDAVNNCYCGPKDTRSGKVARGLCGVSVASFVSAGCGAIAGVLPAQAAVGLASAGGIGCAATPFVGHFGSKCCNTRESRSNTQTAMQLQPISTQPSSNIQQTGTAPLAGGYRR